MLLVISTARSPIRLSTCAVSRLAIVANSVLFAQGVVLVHLAQSSTLNLQMQVKKHNSDQQSSEQGSAAVAVATQAARSHAATVSRMPPKTRHQLLPTQHQHLLLQQATTLIESRSGDINHAFGLLRIAVTHAEARGDVDTRARCLLQLSRIEGLAGECEQAVVLAQAAQQATKDTHVWLQAVLQYSRQRYAARRHF